MKYLGWDPYDGLNSKIFKNSPPNKFGIFRLMWIQGFKRSPINFRKIFLFQKNIMQRAGLFLLGYCNLYRIAQKGELRFGTKKHPR